MTITAPTSPAAEQAVFGAAAESAAGRSWITTTDHRRIGQLQFGFVLAAVAAMGVLGVIVRGSLADIFKPYQTGLASLGVLYAAHEGALAGFIALPIWMATATMFVPGLIGAKRMAFPRAQALVLWMWIVAAALFVSAFLVEDGPVAFNPTDINPLGTSGSANKATELAIGALMMVMLAMLVGAVNIMATVVTEREAGLKFGSIRPFAFGSFVAAALVTLSVPVGLGGYFLTYIDQHFGGSLMAEAGATRIWAHAVYAWGRPDAFVLPIVAVAAFAEVIVNRSGRQLPAAAPANGLLAAAGGFAITTWAGMDYKLSAISAPINRPWTALVFAPLGLVVLMGLAGGRGAKVHPSLLAIGAPLVMGLGGALIAVAAASGVEADGSGAFRSGSVEAFIIGAGLIAMVALVAELGGHVYPFALPKPLLGLALLALIGGAVLSAAGPMLAGIVDADAVESMQLIAMVGKALIAAGAVTMLGAIVLSNGRPASSDHGSHEGAH
jgi:cytochrome c oxidase subunit I